jgi:gentisate 1,2-dioxygenase
MLDAKEVKDFDAEIRQLYMEGLWTGFSEYDKATYRRDPFTKVLPHLWRWSDVSAAVQKAGVVLGVEGMVERRTIGLMNPGLLNVADKRQRATTHTMHMSVQLLKPGEVAPSHRHNYSALRFVIRGRGAYTVVEGEKLVMEEGDLILTPNMMWHGHGNDSNPVIWLDGLDFPALNSLQVCMWEAYPEDFQPFKEQSEATTHRVGLARPVGEKPADYTLQYRWKDTYQTLQNLAGTKGNPFDGVALEYTNPRDGGHTLPTIGCWIQMLRPGEKTKTHRHNSSTIYHAFKGEGSTIINCERFDWSEGDCFVVPLWSWHSHQNHGGKESILFSMTDMPLLDNLRLYKEEAGEGA